LKGHGFTGCGETISGRRRKIRENPVKNDVATLEDKIGNDPVFFSLL
jgi:hypothetical protein